ncbi:MAG TPA: sigma-70 family RNA polymerase sigma factor [Candidatus Acidoferrum sp.]|nr:sigma-70 family RNA polymerase sigma factor [Candidatus Acidoferrum sp.]
MASLERARPRAVSPLPAAPENSAIDDGLSAFISVRPRLFGIAYRMLGSAAEAEDVVQDVWMRWQSTNRKAIVNPAAYLATTTTRLCINLAQSAHARHETYTGVWLPEPVDTSADPGIGAERGETLKLALLLLLEKLSPTERAAYVLREAFDYSYEEISCILQMEVANVRQLVCRARKHIEDGRRTSVGLDKQRRFLQAFIAAAQKGDMTALESLFAEDVVSYSDGGGLVRAAGVPVTGRKKVATFITAVSTWCWNGVTIDWVETNGQAAVLLMRDGVPIGLTIDASAQGINEIMWFLRPSKLAAVSSSGQNVAQHGSPGIAAD